MSLIKCLKSIGLAKSALVGAVLLAIPQGAIAADVIGKVSKLLDDGKIELMITAGSKVAVGDKVRLHNVGNNADKGEPSFIKTRWTIKEVTGTTIFASPDGPPTKMPVMGNSALIASVPAVAPAEKTPTNASEKSEQAAKPAPEKKPATAEMAQKPEKPDAPQAKSEADKNTEMKPQQTTHTTSCQSGQSGTKGCDGSMKPVEKSEQVKEAQEITKTGEVKDAAKAKEAAEAKLAAEKAAEKAKAEAMLAKAREAKDQCDSLAAHAFDPDAVKPGVSYADLDAAAAIDACSKAVQDFPDEARLHAQLARALHKQGKAAEALVAMRNGAEKGSAHAMAYLGVMHKTGQGVRQNSAVALAWFEKAARQGNPGAMVFAGSMLRDGDGITRNLKRAAHFFQMASDLNVAEASANMGIFFDQGTGVDKSPIKAAAAFLKAFRVGDKTTTHIFNNSPYAISEATRKAIQQQLKSMGFYKSKLDGDFGPGTRKALARFKASKPKAKK